uniref:Uncharacterized protein n=1 Tax=Myoviridae sp. ctcFb5 TaxID=2825137 RepID=A0A8S5PWS0_9CAUD|nr:MAG TPA: hypothetical protein [Myoviridae sp. ctcFb5]DAK86756.1 MAG TPA: hypothetical protein [Caudoviricetes sp.]
MHIIRVKDFGPQRADNVHLSFCFVMGIRKRKR